MRILITLLTELTRIDKPTGNTVPFQWSEEFQKAFKENKNCLSTALLLHPLDVTKPFYLWVDISIASFGEILEQEVEDGRTAPVAVTIRPICNLISGAEIYCHRV